MKSPMTLKLLAALAATGAVALSPSLALADSGDKGSCGACSNLNTALLVACLADPYTPICTAFSKLVSGGEVIGGISAQQGPGMGTAPTPPVMSLPTPEPSPPAY
jgi:hypothetical protein